ncbi:MAG: tail fiber domain-containing protein, partial [Proteobacteria bacterium]|nr:tail fiber domain-containing protein [Pseudomonadota bacterium]
LDTPISSDDDDVSYDFGRAKLGYDATNTDRAIFAHRDHATSTAAAFAQEADGDAIINAPTGQTIQFKSNGSDTVRINSAGQLGVGTTSIDALFHVEDGAAGAAALGSDVIALFESNANMGIQMSAPTNSNFTIRANTPAGSATDLTLEYRSQFATLDIELGATYGYNAGQAIFGPRVDNIAALGSTSNRYTEVWAVDGTINTSDSDDKEGIVNASLGLDFINRLQPKEWKWKESKTIVDGKVKFKAAKDKRKHTGLVAQDVKAVLDDLKINTKDFAGYISGEDGKLGLRYHEFTAPMIKAIQELSARVEQLEAA